MLLVGGVITRASGGSEMPPVRELAAAGSGRLARHEHEHEHEHERRVGEKRMEVWCEAARLQVAPYLWVGRMHVAGTDYFSDTVMCVRLCVWQVVAHQGPSPLRS